MKSRGELTRPTQFVRCVEHDWNMTHKLTVRKMCVQYHPELGERQRPVADTSQRMIKQVVAQLQLNSVRMKQITKFIASFIAMIIIIF